MGLTVHERPAGGKQKGLATDPQAASSSTTTTATAGAEATPQRSHPSSRSGECSGANDRPPAERPPGDARVSGGWGLGILEHVAVWPGGREAAAGEEGEGAKKEGGQGGTAVTMHKQVERPRLGRS